MTQQVGRPVKTPTLIQMEAAECGAVCLSIVLEFYGRVVLVEEMRVACGVSRDGVKASNMVKAAQAYGLAAEGFSVEPMELGAFRMPAVIHWNFNHFVVLEGARGNKFYINDPATGRRTVSHKEFDRSFTGVLLHLEPTANFKKGGKRRGVLQAMTSRFSDVSSFGFLTLLSFLLMFTSMVLPFFAKFYIDEILVNQVWDWFLPLILAMGAILTIRVALRWVQANLLLRFRTKLTAKESLRFFSKMFQLPIPFFEQRMVGDLVRRMSHNARVGELLTGKLAAVFFNLLSVVFFGALMMMISTRLFLVSVFIASINIIFLKLGSRFRKDNSTLLMIEQGKMYGFGASGLRQIESIKACGADPAFFEKMAGIHARMMNTKQRLDRVDTLLGTIPSYLSDLNRIIILCLSAWLIIQGEMTLGSFVAFQMLNDSFIGPLNSLTTLVGTYQEATGLMAQLDDIYHHPPDPSLKQPQPEDDPRGLRGHLQLKGLTFGYSRLEKPFIENFDLRLQPGVRVALVGRTGSGKSTITRLISGLHLPWEGDILFDEKPRATWDRQTLSASVAAVDQQLFFFEGTVRENLTLWDPTCSDEALVRAAKDAEIYEDIVARFGGFSSKVEEGGKNFSGGQLQRLEIARALVTNPTILILDEATSALDAQTETRVMDHIRKRGCACLIVAHRLSTVRGCDEILLMENGKTIQRGTHHQLVSCEGAYLELMKAY